MYDVVYIDHSGVETVLADRLPDRRSASDIARDRAAELDVGRMVLPGSVKQRNCVFVVPVRGLVKAA